MIDLSNINKILEERQKNKEKEHINSKVLLVDGINLFIRGYASNPSSNRNGDHVGGIVGALTSLSYAIKTFKPTRCIVVFDGKNGSYRRKKIFPDYKSNRKSKPKIRPKYNRTFEIDPLTEDRNRIWQANRFINYLDELPVSILQLDYIEADDVIAQLNKYMKEQYDSNIVIMSTDKDFLQLVDNNTKVWSPSKKKIYTKEKVFEDYGINSKNFVKYRAIDGDISDNVPGVNGLGLKTIIKMFGNILNEDRDIEFDELIEEAKNIKGKKAKTFVESKDILERNYMLMQLKDPLIPGEKILTINESLDNKIQELNKFKIQIMIKKDLMEFALKNTISFIDAYFRLNMFAKQFNESK